MRFFHLNKYFTAFSMFSNYTISMFSMLKLIESNVISNMYEKWRQYGMHMIHLKADEIFSYTIFSSNSKAVLQFDNSKLEEAKNWYKKGEKRCRATITTKGSSKTRGTQPRFYVLANCFYSVWWIWSFSLIISQNLYSKYLFLGSDELSLLLRAHNYQTPVFVNVKKLRYERNTDFQKSQD